MSVLRVWNLRRGDYDDNRSSPSAGGLRSLFVAALFEFNYVKAPLTFLALIVLPALLVGIAPSVVVTYGHVVFHTATLAGTHLVIVLCLLAALLGVAFWIGRPLLSRAFGDFRHLHYTLIFPIFVALRELLRTIAERLGGRSMTPEQLGRSRQIATAVAALLFSAGGLALAFAVQTSIGLQLIDVEHVRSWALIKTALGNAAMIIGVSTAFESLLWFWRELTLSSPALDWVPEPLQTARPTLRVAHLSDLHLVGERYGYRMEAGTRGPRGNKSFRNALRKLTAIHARTPLDCVLITGDITDAGTRAEWAEFIDLLRSCRELRQRLRFVLGNHDVNIVDRANPARSDLPWSAAQALRKFRCVLALDEIEGDRVRVVDRVSGALGPLLKDFLRYGGRVERLRALAERGGIRGRWEMEKTWDDIFPLIQAPSSENGYGLILLDSNASSHFSLTNAIGFVSPAQLKALKSVLRSFPRSAWIVLLHHAVVEYPVPNISLKDRIGLALINAPDVLAAITPYASHVVILHGHRHHDWIGTWRDIVLSSSPSVALGSGGEEYRGCFHVHELALGAEGSIRLIATRRIEVA